MNILMVLRGNYPPDARVRKESKSLVQAGHDIVILCMGDGQDRDVNGSYVREINRVNPDFSIEGVRQALPILLRNVYPFWQSKISNAVDEFAIDAIHVHDLPLCMTVLESQFGLPVVLDMHENYKEAIRYFRSRYTWQEVATNPKELINRIIRPTRRYHRLQTSSMRRSDHIISTVPEAKKVYEKEGVRGGKISIVSNTVDLEWFDSQDHSASDLNSNRFVITYVGGVSGPHRGIDTVIWAMPEIVNNIPEVTLRIAGKGGQYQEKLQKLSNELEVEKYVEFTGWIDETSFPKYMTNADIGLIPHRSNPHTDSTVPHKLFQYMAAELPVLATDTAAVSRIINETKCGVIVPPDDPMEIARTVNDLAKSDDLTEYGKKGRIAVEDSYNWSIDGEKLQNVYSYIDNTT